MAARLVVYSTRHQRRRPRSRREGRPVTARGLSLALLVLSLASSCRRATGDEPLVRRLGADGAWHHCTVSGERRPAADCPRPDLAASANDVAVPESGDLEVELPARAPGPVIVVPETLTFEQPPTESLSRTVWSGMASALQSSREYGALEKIVGQFPEFRAVPQAATHSVLPPRRVVLRFAAGDRGRRAAYAVWVWPVHPARVTLGPVTPGAHDRLAITFGVQEAAWSGGGPPVRFRVIARGARGTRVLWARALDPVRVAADRGWQEAESEPPAAGERTLLEARALGEPSLPVWGRPALVDVAGSPEDHPSLLLLSIDTLRADHVGVYGYGRATTPTLDRLANAGVLFEQTIAPFPSTTASHMTMLTSLAPCAHGVLVIGSPPLGDDVRTVAQQIAAHGYATVAITEDALIKGDLGFERGFDSYRDLFTTGKEPLGIFDRGIALARDWLDRHGHRPFFMFLHTYQVHIPYKVPPQYADLFPIADDADEARRQERDYDRGLRYADELLSGFVAYLEQSGILAHTVLVVTSDHGTEFGDHGGIGHARGVYEEQIRVPLIVVHPTLAEHGRRIHEQVGIVDVTPTLVELAGAERAATFTGRSLVPLLPPATSRPPDQELFAEQLWGPRQTLLRTARWAWIAKASGVEFYDLTTDPREQHDLAAEQKAAVAEGTGRIERFRADCSRLQVALRRSGAAASGVDAERQRALRALGYVR